MQRPQGECHRGLWIGQQSGMGREPAVKGWKEPVGTVQAAPDAGNDSSVCRRPFKGDNKARDKLSVGRRKCYVITLLLGGGYFCYFVGNKFKGHCSISNVRQFSLIMQEYGFREGRGDGLRCSLKEDVSGARATACSHYVQFSTKESVINKGRATLRHECESSLSDVSLHGRKEVCLQARLCNSILNLLQHQ